MTGETGRVREMGAVNGVGVLAAYTYDDLGGTAYDLTRTFTRDATGAILTASGNNDAYAYPVRAARTQGYGVDRLNRYTSQSSATFGYDGNGNLTTSTNGGTTQSFGYMADNLMASAPGGNLVYDALDRLQKIGGAGTILCYQGANVVTEHLNSGGTVQRRYVPGDAPDETLVWFEGSGNQDRRWLHADERGSTIAVTDGNGNARTVAAYDEFGTPSNPDDAELGRFRYTGQMWLSEIRGYYYKARMYSPNLGRFFQTDPIGYAGGMNLYAYVGNDPVNYSDPTGLVCYKLTANNEYDTSVEQFDAGDCAKAGGSYQPDIVVNGGGGGGGDFASPPFGSGSGSGGGSGGGGGGFTLAPYETPKAVPQNDNRKISPCMQAFLAKQGYGASNLPNVTFHNGADGSLLAKAAFAHGNPAITIQNNVYVALGQWNNFRPGTAGFFEETIHTIQWDQSGAFSFSAWYLAGSAMGVLATGDGHNSPIEAQAMGISQDLAKAYAKSGGCPR